MCLSNFIYANCKIFKRGIKMKVIHKFFVIALLLSLIFSVSAVVAAENMTFEQGNMEDVSRETLSVSSDDIQKIGAVEDESSVNAAEDGKEPMQIRDDNNQLTADEPKNFTVINRAIENASNGDTIYLNGSTYVANKTNINFEFKNLTIVGGSSLNDGKYAILDANGLSSILSISRNYYYGYYDYYYGSEHGMKNYTVTLDSIIFCNSSGTAIEASCNLNIKNCYFINNNGRAIDFRDCLAFESYDYYGGGIYYSQDTYNLNVIDSYFINNTAGWGSIIDISESDKVNWYYVISHKQYGKKTFRNCVFENNTASYGGAIRLGYGGNIQNCTFISNSAKYGGAIYCAPETYYRPQSYRYAITNLINNSEFINNRAVEGGAVYGDYINITNSKFTSNTASYYGGALNLKSYLTMHVSNNEFTDNYAPYYNSHSMYFTSNNDLISVDLRENIVNSDKTEIYFDKAVTGLYTYVLDNTSVSFCEGKIKIYALVTDDEGNKISGRTFTFLVGKEEFTTKIVDSMAEIDYYATISNDNGKRVSENTTGSRDRIYDGFLRIIPFSFDFDFEDYTGAMGTAIKVPVYINDAAGHPIDKTIIARYNGFEKTISSYNGIAHVLISLPLQKTTFNLTVECENTYKTKQIHVMDPHDSDAIVIEMAQNESGYVGRTVTVPVFVHDGHNNPLIGDISVSYYGEDRTIPLIDGVADVLISLPVYETSFNLTVSFKGIHKVCKINVIDPISEIDANINLNHSVSGNIGTTLTVPVSVLDGDGKALKGNITVSYNDQQKTLNLIDGKADIVIGLPIHKTSFELTVNYKGNIKSCLVEVIDPNNITQVSIKVNESFTGQPGKSITIPISVVDQNGKPLSGAISVSYNGHEKNVTLVNGKSDVVIALPLAETSFELAIKYNGYMETTNITVVDLKPHVNSIITLPANITENIGKTIIIPVYVKDEDGNHLTGDIVVYYNNQEKNLTLVDGHANIIISSQLHPTSFELTVMYQTNRAHCMVNVVDSSHPVADVVIDLPQNESGHVGKTIIIPVKVTDSNGKPLTGKINVYYAGIEGSENLHNGEVDISIILPDTPTVFNLTVSYGDFEKTCEITVVPEGSQGGDNDTEVVIELEGEITGHAGKTLMIPIFIHDGNGKGLEGNTVAMYNHQERDVTLKNGKANIYLALPVNPTTFDFTILFENEFMKTAKITVFDLTNPMGDLNEITSNGNGTLVIPFPGDASGNVTVTINGKDYNGTIINGQVIININDLPDGKYDGTVTYSGDGNYSSSEKTVIIIIKDSGVVDPNHPLANITDATSNDDGTLVIPFPSDAGGSVIVNINGKNYTGKVIDGKVVLDITDLPAGNYTSIIYYSGDGNYTNSTKTIIIIKENTAVSPDNPMGNTTGAESNDNGTVEIPFPSDASGDVIVNIDGKYYTGKIIDGKVVLDVKDIPIGNYNASVYYLGDGKYSSSSRTMTIIIKETVNNNNNQTGPVNPPVAVKKASKITAKKKTFNAAKKVKKYSITLKSGKAPIKNVKVTIKMGKKTYKAKTNGKGKATFKIKKLTEKGKYKAVVKFKGDKTYKATTKKVKITIK